MKKMFLIMSVWFFIVKTDNQYSFLSKKNSDHYHKVDASEEKLHNGSDKDSIEDSLSEYDYYVVDAVKPSKVSQPVALLTQLGCAVLIRYIALQEKAKTYFSRLKNFINSYF